VLFHQYKTLVLPAYVIVHRKAIFFISLTPPGVKFYINLGITKTFKDITIHNVHAIKKKKQSSVDYNLVSLSLSWVMTNLLYIYIYSIHGTFMTASVDKIKLQLT
jgi:hypothetical protein